MGLIAGAIARGILKEKSGWVGCLVLGCVGAVVGGWIGELLFGSGTTNSFSPGSWILAIGGSVLVLWLWRLVTGKR